MTLHPTPLRARVLRTGVATALALVLAGGYAAPAVAAGSSAAGNAGQAEQAKKSQPPAQPAAKQEPKKKTPPPKPEQSKSSSNAEPKKNPTAAEASSTKGKPANPGQAKGKPANPGQGKGKPANPGQGKGKETAPGQVKDGGSATGKGQTKPKGSSGEVGSENGTGQDGSPPGNNGTVKVAPLGELDGIPNNTAHPGCTFQIEWYGFDEGPDVVSTVSFAMQAPTTDVALTVDGPSEVFVGGSPGTGAGNDGLDGIATYTLGFDGEPHAKQGYHVKLTVSTPHSNGNDTKSKVFWVAPCTTTPVPDGVDGEGSDGEGSDGGSTDETDETEQVIDEGTGADGEGSDTTVAFDNVGADGSASGVGEGTQQTAGPVPTMVDAGLRGDWTRSWLPLGVIALGAAMLVAALSVRERSRGQIGA